MPGPTAILSPQGVPTASQWKAFRQVGYICNVDFIFLLLILGHVGLAFSQVEVLMVLEYLVLGTLLTGLWVVLLLFRATYFTIQVWCAIQDVTDGAAQLAVKRLQASS